MGQAAGEVADLGSVADDFSHAYHLKADGRVAGYDAAPHGPNYAARWNPATGRLQDHSAIGGKFAVAWDINSQRHRGRIRRRRLEHTTRAVMWQPASAGTAAEGEFDCAGARAGSQPAVPQPLNTDVGYQVGAVGMAAGPGYAPSTFSSAARLRPWRWRRLLGWRRWRWRYWR